MIRGCSDAGKHARKVPADDEISGRLIPIVDLCQIKQSANRQSLVFNIIVYEDCSLQLCEKWSETGAIMVP